MNVTALLLVFLFGLIVGSFLNVVIARRNTGLSLGGRSFCFSCGTTLSALDLVPLVSFLARKGRCRHCGVAISPMYPLVELATGALFVLVFVRLAPSSIADLPEFALWLWAFALLLCIVAYDIRHKIIPEGMVWSFVALSVLSFLYTSASVVFHVWDLMAGPLLAAPAAALWLLSRGAWMGLGDAKLLLGIGWFLGLSCGVAALMLAVWSGAFFGVCALFPRTLFSRWRDFTIKSELPFAPFIALGTLLSFMYRIDFYDIERLFSFFYPQ